MTALSELIERDGPRCVWCGRQMWPADLTAEHLLPRSRAGHTTAENLAVACRRCNRARGPRSVAAYVRELRATGRQPRLGTLRAALGRLAVSERRAHAQYGARQLELLDRLAGEASVAHPAFAHANVDEPADDGEGQQHRSGDADLR